MRIALALAAFGAADAFPEERLSQRIGTPPWVRNLGPSAQATTHVYKTVGPLDIAADVYRLGDDRDSPVVVWIHGGGLINGHRASIDRRAAAKLLRSGYVILSIDYRLAPESKLPQIVEDVEDAIEWVRRNGRERLRVDPSRIAIVGTSAGAYLALSAGSRVRPRPTVLVSLWGYGDLVGSWYSRPSPHPRHHLLRPSREEAWRGMDGPAIANPADRPGNGMQLYLYSRQKGIWPTVVSGWDPHTDIEKFVPFLPSRNVTKEFPPTILVHGVRDTDVPYEQSAAMARELRRHGVEHRLVPIVRGEHGLQGAARVDVDTGYGAVLEFLDRHMKPAGSARGESPVQP